MNGAGVRIRGRPFVYQRYFLGVYRTCPRNDDGRLRWDGFVERSRDVLCSPNARVWASEAETNPPARGGVVDRKSAPGRA
jgi:hypothetical protein